MSPNIGFRAVAEYDPKTDTTFLTSDSPDFTTPLKVALPRGSEDDKQVRELLQDQGAFDFASLYHTARLPLVNLGEFGEYADGTRASDYRMENQVFEVYGTPNSGYLNFIRLWLHQAWLKGYRVVAFNAPEDLYGTAKYFPYNPVVNVDAYDNINDLIEDYTNDYSNVVFLFADGNEAPIKEVTESSAVSSLLVFERNALEEIVLEYEVQFDDEPEVAEHAIEVIYGPVILPDGFKSEGQRGVMWVNTPAKLERVHTYLLPKSAWQ